MTEVDPHFKLMILDIIKTRLGVNGLEDIFQNRRLKLFWVNQGSLEKITIAPVHEESIGFIIVYFSDGTSQCMEATKQELGL